VPLKFPQRGIKYDELSEADREAWDMADWDEETAPRPRSPPRSINRFLFIRRHTIDKMLQTLMTYASEG